MRMTIGWCEKRNDILERRDPVLHSRVHGYSSQLSRTLIRSTVSLRTLWKSKKKFTSLELSETDNVNITGEFSHLKASHYYFYFLDTHKIGTFHTSSSDPLERHFRSVINSEMQGKQDSKRALKSMDHSLRSDRPARKKHEDMDWYHGLLPRADINALLENDGDFLVRTSHIQGQENAKTVLSVKWKGKCHHWQLQEKEDESIVLDDRKFENVLDMVTTLRSKRLPVSHACPALLLNPILKQEWELRHDQIVLGKMLGEGAFGGVYKATFWCKGEKKMVAVKVNKGNEKISTRNMIEDVCKEARIMRQYQHPNVVCFYGVCVEREPIMLVMELANQGALDSFLKNEKNNISLRDKLKYSLDASKGLEYLHQHGCIHRDVAARNFLMHKNVVKITDFGLSKQLSDLAHKYKLKDLQAKLPIRWLAPEVIVTATYTFKSDVYSFGILLWEIFMDGAIPYPNLKLAEVRQKVKAGYRMEAPDRMPTFVRNIMLQQCWPQSPEDRGSMTEIRIAMESVLDGKAAAFNNRSVYLQK